MPEPLARIVLRWQADANIAEFRRLWPPFDAQPFDVKVALADMAFQLGPAGAAGFGDMLDAVERGDWEAAAKAARDSAWDRETPARVERVVAAFEAPSRRSADRLRPRAGGPLPSPCASWRPPSFQAGRQTR